MAKKIIEFKDHKLSAKKLDDWVKTGSLSEQPEDIQVMEDKNNLNLLDLPEMSVKKLTIRVPASLHKSLKLYCVKNNISLNETILKMIECEISKFEIKNTI